MLHILCGVHYVVAIALVVGAIVVVAATYCCLLLLPLLLLLLLPFAKAFYYFSIYLHFPTLVRNKKAKRNERKEMCMIYYGNALMLRLL